MGPGVIEVGEWITAAVRFVAYGTSLRSPRRKI